MIGYCPKCRLKREMKDTHIGFTANNRKACFGKCAVCGTRMLVFVPK